MISDEAAVIDNLDNQDISDQEFDDLMHSLEEDNADEQSDDETPALSKGKGKAKPKKEIEQGQRINGSGRLQDEAQYAKNPMSLIYHVIKGIIKDFLLLATATPLLNCRAGGAIPKARIEALFKNGKLDDPNGELLAEGKHLNEPLPADQRELIMKMLTKFAGERKEYDAFRSTGSGLAEAAVAHIAQEVATGDEVQSAEHVTRVMAIKGDEAARAKVAQHTLDTWRAGFTTDIPYPQAYAFMKMRGDADNKHNTSQPVSHTWRVRIT
ncbi:hypothetical protein NHJ13734_009581 [Beauveria thailandica]